MSDNLSLQDNRILTDQQTCKNHEGEFDRDIFYTQLSRLCFIVIIISEFNRLRHIKFLQKQGLQQEEEEEEQQKSIKEQHLSGNLALDVNQLQKEQNIPQSPYKKQRFSGQQHEEQKKPQNKCTKFLQNIFSSRHYMNRGWLNIIHCMAFIFILQNYSINGLYVTEDANNLCTCTDNFSICYLNCVSDYLLDDGRRVTVDMTPDKNCQNAYIIESHIQSQLWSRCIGTGEDMEQSALSGIENSAVVIDYPSGSAISGTGFCFFGSKIYRRKMAKIQRYKQIQVCQFIPKKQLIRIVDGKEEEIYQNNITFEVQSDLVHFKYGVAIVGDNSYIEINQNGQVGSAGISIIYQTESDLYSKFQQVLSYVGYAHDQFLFNRLCGSLYPIPFLNEVGTVDYKNDRLILPQFNPNCIIQLNIPDRICIDIKTCKVGQYRFNSLLTFIQYRSDEDCMLQGYRLYGEFASMQLDGIHYNENCTFSVMGKNEQSSSSSSSNTPSNKCKDIYVEEFKGDENLDAPDKPKKGFFSSLDKFFQSVKYVIGRFFQFIIDILTPLGAFIVGVVIIYTLTKRYCCNNKKQYQQSPNTQSIINGVLPQQYLQYRQSSVLANPTTTATLTNYNNSVNQQYIQQPKTITITQSSQQQKKNLVTSVNANTIASTTTTPQPYNNNNNKKDQYKEQYNIPTFEDRPRSQPTNFLIQNYN